MILFFGKVQGRKMIKKVIQEILAKDEIDGSMAAELTRINKILPEVLTIEGEDWRWLSLKTLLGYSGSDWADRKIKFRSYSEQSDNLITKENELPLIQIYAPQSFVFEGRAGDKDRVKTSLKIGVNASTESTYSNFAQNILKRIRKVLTCSIYESLGVMKSKHIINKYGIHEIEIRPTYFDTDRANQVSGTFSIETLEY